MQIPWTDDNCNGSCHIWGLNNSSDFGRKQGFWKVFNQANCWKTMEYWRNRLEAIWEFSWSMFDPAVPSSIFPMDFRKNWWIFRRWIQTNRCFFRICSTKLHFSWFVNPNDLLTPQKFWINGTKIYQNEWFVNPPKRRRGSTSSQVDGSSPFFPGVVRLRAETAPPQGYHRVEVSPSSGSPVVSQVVGTFRLLGGAGTYPLEKMGDFP